MSKSRRYAKAPITEAVIDLKVKFATPVSMDALTRLSLSESDRYPTRNIRLRVFSQFTAGAQVGSATQQKETGFICRDKDERQVYQCTLEGFTFSRLAPYDRWEPFRDESKRLWDLYRGALPIEKIERVAVRYINRLNLPADSELQDYLRTFPELSKDLPQDLNEFFMRLETRASDPDASVVITQTTLPAVQSETRSLILDDDIYREANVPQDEDSLWELIEGFRDHKNRVFEACITDKLRELID